MLTGIGTDIVSTGRLREAAGRTGERILQRLFTPAERAYCDRQKRRWECYAARYAAKEAVLKALGSGLSGCRWTEVEIGSNEAGRPEVVLSGGAAEVARRLGVTGVLVSIAHERDNAVAFAVALRET